MRADLLALTPDAVAALSNTGLVKRAQKEIADGKGPALAEEADGTVIGTVTELGKEIVAKLVPKRSLKDCVCSCGSVSVCRHRVATALAYPAWIAGGCAAAPGAVPSTGTSPSSTNTSPSSTNTSRPSTNTSPSSTNTSRPSADTSPPSADTFRPSTDTSRPSTDTSPASTTSTVSAGSSISVLASQAYGAPSPVVGDTSAPVSTGTVPPSDIAVPPSGTTASTGRQAATPAVPSTVPSPSVGKRADLLALTADAVAALSNMGLVKRAQKEIADAKGPDLTEASDGTVTGTVTELGKEVVCRLPPGKSLKESTCSCGSVVVCRHRVAAALAYRDWVRAQVTVLAESPPLTTPSADPAEASSAPVPAPKASPTPHRPVPPTFRYWSPASISEEILSKELGKKAMEDAKKARKKGIMVEVRLPSPEEPHPTALLPSCTVKFLVPDDIAYARCDCFVGEKCMHLALAIWAFRQVQGRDESRREWKVEVREAGKAVANWPALDAALALSRELLLEGVVNARESMGQAFALVRQGLEKAGYTWPTFLVEDLEAQFVAYRKRSARYHAAEVASLLGEIAARSRALGNWSEELAQQGALPPKHLLGEGEKLETRLDKIRLISLGARIEADGDDRYCEVLLADPDTAMVLVLEKEFLHEDAANPPPLAPALAHRRIATSISLGIMASGQVVTKVAHRRANRAIRLGQGTGGATSVTPQTGDWGQIPAPLRIVSLKTLAEEWEAREPRALRPRLRAKNVHVMPIGEIQHLSYDPADQKLVALAADAEGETFLLTRTYRSVAPKALDHLAAALSGKYGTVRFVSGELRRHLGNFELEVIAVAADRIVIPDLEDGPVPSLEPTPGLNLPHSPVEDALQEACSALEDGAHQGLKGMPTSTYALRLAESAARLDDVGMTACARRVRAFERAIRGAAVGGAPAWDAACLRWEDAAIRLALARELCG